MIGRLSKKIITGIVPSKIFQQCSIAEGNGEEPPKHVCPRNYDGSCKMMESDAALHFYKTILRHQIRCFILNQSLQMTTRR